MFIYEIQKQKVKISASYGYSDIIQIPEEIDGYPVTELFPYSFSFQAVLNSQPLTGLLINGQASSKGLLSEYLLFSFKIIIIRRLFYVYI